MSENKFDCEDLVWAKMKGFPFWPAEIIKPPEGTTVKKHHHYVHFFTPDTRNCAWIADELIKRHSEEMFNTLPKKISKDLNIAIDHIKGLAAKRPPKPPMVPIKIESDSDDNDSPLISSIKRKATKDKGLRTETTLGNEIKIESESDESSPLLISNSNKKRKATKAIKDKQLEWDQGSPLFTTSVKRKKAKVRRLEKSVDDQIKIEDESDDDQPLISIAKRKTTKAKQRRINTIKFKTEDDKDAIFHSASSIKRKATATKSRRTNVAVKTESQKVTLQHSGMQSLFPKTAQYGPATSLKIGVIGLGYMGCALVRNLLLSGHNVTVFNRTKDKYHKLGNIGAKVAATPADLVKACDVVFSCLSDQGAVNQVVFGRQGFLKGLDEKGRNSNVGYVEMTAIDGQFSSDLSESIIHCGGRYLEAQILGNRQEADIGALTLICGGSHELFSSVSTCLHAMSKTAVFLSCKVGEASMVRVIISALQATMYAATAEALALCERNNVSQFDFIDICKSKQFLSDPLADIALAMLHKKFSPADIPLKHQQKDLFLSLILGDRQIHPMPIARFANSIFVHTKRIGYGEHDATAIYHGVKF